MAQIKLHQLTQKFYDLHTHLVEVTDKSKDGKSFVDKGRGYGVLMVDIKGHQFAIPLRSKMKHKENFHTKIYTENKQRYKKGLDYSKAVIITDPTYIATGSFKIDQDEFLKIAKSENHIITSFEKYVDRYILAYNKGDQNILKAYKFSTLQNYHVELGCV